MNDKVKKYGKMTLPKFYCKKFIDCHSHLPKYQPNDCKIQCHKCIDEIIEHHEKKGNYKK